MVTFITIIVVIVMINILIVIFNVCSNQKKPPQADVDSLGGVQHYLPSFIYHHPIHTHAIIMSSSRLLIYHQTVTLGYQSIASGCVVSGFARETSVQTNPQQCQRNKNTRVHTHYKHKKESKPKKKKKEQKKEVKHRRSPYCPQTPALHPYLPPAPLLCLQRSDQRAKRKEEKKKRRRRRSGQERRSQSCRGKKARRRGEGGRGAGRRCARSGGPKNQKVTQNQKLLLLLLVMYE